MTHHTKHTNQEPIDGPAKLQPDHVQTRNLTTVAGGPKGWKRESPLEAAYDRGQLAGGSQTHTAEERYEAGMLYTKFFDTAQPGTKDSTDIERVMHSGSGEAFTTAQAVAIRSLVSIDSHMSQRDRMIIRMVCGQGFFASEAVRHVCGDDYRHTVWARFREALDGLVEAVAQARKTRFAVFNVSRGTSGDEH